MVAIGKEWGFVFTLARWPSSSRTQPYDPGLHWWRLGVEVLGKGVMTAALPLIVRRISRT